MLASPPCQRTGLMAAFTSLQEFKKYLLVWSNYTLHYMCYSMFESLMNLFISESDMYPLSPLSSSTGDLASIQEEEDVLVMKLPDLPPSSPGNVRRKIFCIA